MRDWNVVITVNEDGYNKARVLLEKYGPMEKSDYFNILVMKVSDQLEMMDQLQAEGARDPQSIAPLARVMPVIIGFDFETPEEFEERAREAVTAWLPSLGGKSFHVRMHRRGFKGKLSGMEEEKFLDRYLLEELEKRGAKGRISFDDPNAIIAVETLGPRAGLSLWTRDHLKRYPLLHLD